MKKKKVLFISSTGGHLNELLQLSPLFEKYDYNIITEKDKTNEYLKACDSTEIKDGISLYQLLKRPEIKMENINHFIEINYSDEIKEQVEILQALLHKDLNLSHQKEEKESIEFYKSLGTFKRFKFLFWYWRNFYKINCCSDKKLKISCFIKNIILGI